MHALQVDTAQLPHSCGPRARRSMTSTRQPVTTYSSNGASPKDVDKGLNLLSWTGKVVPQGLLVKSAKTVWNTAWRTFMKELAPQSKDGSYQRPAYHLNGLIGEGWPEESGRYHLYIGNACPWCHRVILTLIVRGLLPHLSYTWAVDDAERASRGGWVFDAPEPVFGQRDLRLVYEAGDPKYSGRCTAPLLVDKETRQLVNNESSELVRMLNSLSLGNDVDLYPPDLAAEIDAVNDDVFQNVNNGTYRSGFATSQGAYEAAQEGLWAALDRLEQRLLQHRFLVGDRFTEADLRLFPTAVRFDAVYSTLFKCTRRRLAQYPALSAWLRDVYQLPLAPSPGGKAGAGQSYPAANGVSAPQLQVRDSVDVDAARESYFRSLFPLNAGGIVPVGPTLADLALDAPPGRGPQTPDAVYHWRKGRVPAAAA